MKKYLFFLAFIPVIIFSQTDVEWKYWEQGKESYEKGLYSQAIEYFNKAISLNPGNSNFFLYRGYAKEKLEDFKGAIDDFKIICEMIPDEPAYYLLIAKNYEKLNLNNNAEQYFTEALSYANNQYEYYFNRGTYYLKQKRFKNAKEDLEIAYLLEPANLNVINNLGISLYNLKEYQEGCHYFNKIIHTGIDISTSIKIPEKCKQNSSYRPDIIYYYRRNGSAIDNINNAEHIIKLYQFTDQQEIYLFEYSKDDKWELSSQRMINAIDSNSFVVSNANKDGEPDEFIRSVIDSNSIFYIIDYKKTGQKIQEGFCSSYFPLNKEGKFYNYYSDGKLRSENLYVYNQLKSNIRWKRDGTEGLKDVFQEVDTIPKFNGKSADEFRIYIAKNLRYPEECAEQGIQGRIIYCFVILENGSVGEIQVLEGVHPALDIVGLDLILGSDIKWTPAFLDGKPVRFEFTFPIVFSLK